MHSAFVVLLSPAQLYCPCIELTFTLGKRVSYETTLIQNNGSTIISLYKFLTFCICIVSSIGNVHITTFTLCPASFSLRIAIQRVSYDNVCFIRSQFWTVNAQLVKRLT